MTATMTVARLSAAIATTAAMVGRTAMAATAATAAMVALVSTVEKAEISGWAETAGRAEMCVTKKK